MILKLGLQHQGLKLYKVYINDDPGLTYFMARSNLIAYAFEWGKCYKVIYDLLLRNQKFYDLETRRWTIRDSRFTKFI